jgi:hypothetical protein
MGYGSFSHCASTPTTVTTAIRMMNVSLTEMWNDVANT